MNQQYINSGYDALRSRAGLGAHRFLLRAGLAGSLLFAWIFIFQYYTLDSQSVYFGLQRVLFLYGLSQIVCILLTPLCARTLRNGAKRMMVFSISFLSLAYIGLAVSLAGLLGESTALGFLLFSLALGAYQAMYWIPYSVEYDAVGRNAQNFISKELLLAMMPILAGIALFDDPFAPISLLFGMVGLFMVSLLPLIHVPEQYEGFSWSFQETFGELIEPAHRHFVASSLASGFEGTLLLLFWPIAIFLILGGSFPLFGILMGFTLLVSLILKDAGQTAHASSPLLAAAHAASTWIIRIFVITPVSLMLVETYGSGVPGTRSDHFATEQRGDNGSYIDELSALKEISLALGRLLAALFAALLLGFLPYDTVLPTLFLCAAIIAAFSVYRAHAGHPVS